MSTRLDLVDGDKYRKHLLRAQDSGNWFLFRRVYVKIMSRNEALFLQDLINHASSKWTKKLKDKGKEYFLCTVSYLEESLDWDRNIQQRLIDALTGRGFLLTTKLGMPAVRYIHVNVEAIEDAIDKWEASQSTSNDVNKMTSNDDDKTTSNDVAIKDTPSEYPYKEKTHCCGGGRNSAREPFGKAKLPPTPRKHPRGQPPVQPTGNGRATLLNGTTPRSEEERLASKLFKAIDGASKVQRSADITKWAATFREFIPKVKGGRAHFVRVLDWYCANVGRRFTPAAYSAKTFCDKFDNIVRSMQVQAQAARKDDGGRRKNANDYLDDNFIPPDDDNLLPPDQRW